MNLEKSPKKILIIINFDENYEDKLVEHQVSTWGQMGKLIDSE